MKYYRLKESAPFIYIIAQKTQEKRPHKFEY